MPIIDASDKRIKFADPPIPLLGKIGVLCVFVYGGPLARVYAAFFDAKDERLTSVGPLTTEHGGRARWDFQAPANASYLKWRVEAVRSAANLGTYHVVSTILDPAGQTLATGMFDGSIPDGQFADEIIYDGASFGPAQGVPAGTNV